MDGARGGIDRQRNGAGVGLDPAAGKEVVIVPAPVHMIKPAFKPVAVK